MMMRGARIKGAVSAKSVKRLDTGICEYEFEFVELDS
jgi:hypothetical protein